MANGKIEGLLGNPGFTTGLGLLSAGLSQPQNLGQGLLSGLQAGGQLQEAGLRNRALREELQATSRRRRAMAEIPELIKSFGPLQSPMARTPQTGLLSAPQTETLGLLAQADPAAALTTLSSQLFPEERSQTSLVRNLRAAGIDPMSEEGRKLVVDNIRSAGGDELQAMLAQVQLQREMTELSARERELTEEEEEKRQSQARRLDSVMTTADNIDQMSDMLGILEQSGGLEPGVGFETERRAISGIIAGITGDEQRSAANTAYDNLRRLSESEALKRAGSILSEMGTISNAKFNAARETLADPSSTPAAMRLAMADILDASVRGAEIEGLELENADALKEQINRLRTTAQEALRPNDRRERPEAGSEDQSMRFRSEREAQAAIERGDVRVGDTVIVNGRRFRVEE